MGSNMATIRDFFIIVLIVIIIIIICWPCGLGAAILAGLGAQ